jgi:uncharacterized protein (DUF1697 family)
VTRYVALLRGINVGGKNIIRMAELRDCLTQAGFADVRTYIQSGNVLFDGSGTTTELVQRLQNALAAGLSYEAPIALRSRRQLENVIRRAPAGFGEAPNTCRYDVIYLPPDLSAAKALAQVPRHPEIDTAEAGPGVLYFSRPIAGLSKSRLRQLSALPVYQRMTVRNWNTTMKLRALLAE